MSSTNSTPEIDIYHCSTNALVPLPLMVAIMTAASEGKPVQSYDYGSFEWVRTEHPVWDWSKRSYRIDPASRPPSNWGATANWKTGDWAVSLHDKSIQRVVDVRHYPANLDCNAMRMDDCSSWSLMSAWRRASNEEIKTHLLSQASNAGFKVGVNVSFAAFSGPITEMGVWLPGEPVPDGHNTNYVMTGMARGKPFVYVCFDTSLSGNVGPLHMGLDQLTLVPTKIKVPLTSNDLRGPILWYRHSLNSHHSLITYVSGTEIKANGVFMRLDDLANGHAEWSTNRQHWRPFWKEVRA